MRVLPHHYSRLNASEPLPPDKRQFIHPPAPAPQPLSRVPTTKPLTTATRAQATTAPALESTPGQPVTVSTITTTGFTSAPTSLTTTDGHESSTFLSSSTPPHRHSTAFSTVRSAISSQAPTSTNQLTTSSEMSADGLANIENPNDTKWSLGRNHTAASETGHSAAGDDPWGDRSGARMACSHSHAAGGSGHLYYAAAGLLLLCRAGVQLAGAEEEDGTVPHIMEREERLHAPH